MICGASPLSSAKDEFLAFEDEKSMSSGNVSSTLQKLYTWEKKLYDEVKVCSLDSIFAQNRRRFLLCLRGGILARLYFLHAISI